jgi:acetyl esterase/lipase
MAGRLAFGLWLGGILLAPAEEKTAAAGIPEGVELLSAIQFGEGDGQPLLLDLARPKANAGPYPALVFVHGGGWAAGDRSGYRDLMLAWSKFGIVCVTVEYRLAPKYRFPSQLEDVKCAVRWVRANAVKYHVDPKRIGAVGGSAGAHLVGMLGTTSGSGKWEGAGGNADQSSAIQMMICHGTPSDLLMGYEHSVKQSEQEGPAVRGMLTAFLGGAPDEVKTIYLDASPVQHVSKTTPPTLLLHGVNDTLVLLEQAEVFSAALEKAAVPVELVRMEGAGHADFGTQPEKVFARVGEFLKKYLLQL